MTDAHPPEEATLFPRTPGERLREAREAKGLTLDEIAARTRVPVRQLEAIEQGNYAGLPSITYSIGFARAYARAVGLDEVQIASEVRAQNTHTTVVRRPEYEAYSPDEVTRVPTNRVAILGVIVALALVVASALWYGTTWFRGGSGPAPAATDATTAEQSVPAAPPTAAPVPTSGQVTLTATDEVWLRVYDAANKTLYIGTLKPGEKFDVPGDANEPMINVGRPDKLTVTVNGTAVPPLGTGKVAIKNVKVSAAALAARGAPATVSAPAVTVAAPAPVHAAATSRAQPAHRAEVPPPANSAQPLNIAAPAASAPPAPAPAATPLP